MRPAKAGPRWRGAVLAMACSVWLTACGGGADPSAAADGLMTASGQAARSAGGSRSLSRIEADGLIFMRQEEQLARDVYGLSLTQYAMPIFGNIADSEQSHLDAVQALLDKYGLTNPLAGLPTGVFVDPELQTSYDELVAHSQQGLVQALEAGMRIEEMDMVDIQLRIDQTDNADIQRVYENLLRGSRNHLRAFYSTLLRQGGSYTPVYISQEAFDAIVESGAERGR